MKNLNKTTKIVLLSIAILLSTYYATAQTFFNLGFDPKMAIQGPGYSYEQKSTLDFEATIGFHLDTKVGLLRISQSHKSHKAISFYKATWVAVDYTLQDRLLWIKAKGFRQYAGLEFSSIYRSNIRAYYGYDNTVRDNNNIMARFGARVELMYIHPSSYIGFYMKYSGYQGEEINNGEFNKYRHEGTIGITIFFN